MRNLSVSRTSIKSKFIITLMLICALIFSIGYVNPVYAVTDSQDLTDKQIESREALGDYVQGAVADKKYQTSSGAYLQGKSVVDDLGKIDQDAFNSLTNKAKKTLLNDMLQASDEKIAKDKDNPGEGSVSEDTKSSWLQDLQNTNGLGSQLMNNILSQTKPDFVKAQRIWAPFASPLGTVIALLCIIIGSLLTLSMAVDLAWMAIPFLRGFNQEGDTPKRPWCISFEAFSSVTEAETTGEGKTGKVAVLLYFKKRVIMLTVIGVCLLYLVQGEIFVFVSMILDLVSGFIGF